jgi:hypothetical protein
MIKDKLNSLFRSCLFSFVLIPISDPTQFLDLKYSKLKGNTVEFVKKVVIKVDSSASPLFYKLPDVKKAKTIEVSGFVEILKKNNPQEDDSYFQLGIIYEGSYRPGSFVKSFLPEWLLKVLSINDKYGVGRIDFYEASDDGKVLDKNDSIRDIKIHFETITQISSDHKFKFKINLRDAKILGLWLRADGDESKSKFTTHLTSMKINY